MVLAWCIPSPPSPSSRRIRVVAVFAAGPEWQFNGWRWGRPAADPRPSVTPTEIFERALGFHLHYEGEKVHENIAKWGITPLAVSKSRRHGDAGLVQEVWAAVDKEINLRKPYLAPKGV